MDCRCSRLGAGGIWSNSWVVRPSFSIVGVNCSNWSQQHDIISILIHFSSNKRASCAVQIVPPSCEGSHVSSKKFRPGKTCRAEQQPQPARTRSHKCNDGEFDSRKSCVKHQCVLKFLLLSLKLSQESLLFNAETYRKAQGQQL